MIDALLRPLGGIYIAVLIEYSERLILLQNQRALRGRSGCGLDVVVLLRGKLMVRHAHRVSMVTRDGVFPCSGSRSPRSRAGLQQAFVVRASRTSLAPQCSPARK